MFGVTILPMCIDQSLRKFRFNSPQILELASNKEEISSRVHKVIDEFAERGLRALGVAMQVRIAILQMILACSKGSVSSLG